MFIKEYRRVNMCNNKPIVNSIDICGHTYKVSTFDDSGVDIAQGVSCQPDLYIKYRGNLPASNAHEVLLHEAIHMISDSLELDLEEKQVVGLGNGLYQFIRNNSYLVSLIMKAKICGCKGDCCDDAGTLIFGPGVATIENGKRIS